MDDRAATIRVWRMASTVPVKRGTRAEPIRANDLYQPAELSQGHRKPAVRRDTYAPGLALLFRRLVSRGCNSFQPEARALPRTPSGIQRRVGGKTPARPLHRFPPQGDDHPPPAGEEVLSRPLPQAHAADPPRARPRPP